MSSNENNNEPSQQQQPGIVGLARPDFVEIVSVDSQPNEGEVSTEGLARPVFVEVTRLDSNSNDTADHSIEGLARPNFAEVVSLEENQENEPSSEQERPKIIKCDEREAAARQLAQQQSDFNDFNDLNKDIQVEWVTPVQTNGDFQPRDESIVAVGCDLYGPESSEPSKPVAIKCQLFGPESSEPSEQPVLACEYRAEPSAQSEPVAVGCELYGPESTSASDESKEDFIVSPEGFKAVKCTLFAPPQEDDEQKQQYVLNYNLSSRQYDLVSEFFNNLSKDGKLDSSLIKDLISQGVKSRKEVHVGDEDISRGLSAVDGDNDGKITFDELIRLLLLIFSNKENLLQRAQTILNVISTDKQKDGVFGAKELGQFGSFLQKFFNKQPQQSQQQDQNEQQQQQQQESSNNENEENELSFDQLKNNLLPELAKSAFVRWL